MADRKLASIREVAEIRPIAGADAIECAVVDGWTVVVKKGEFQPGDLAVYFEIDSWVPNEIAPFLSKGKEPREFEGVKGERLRTIKLRGQLSQGLLLQMNLVGFDTVDNHPIVGMDLTELLGVKKWEKPVPAQLRGLIRGNFPSFLRKTDQERCQNIAGKLFSSPEYADAWYEATMKLDGSSMTVYFNDGDIGVCSRNIDLKLDQDGNTFVDMAKRSGLFDAVRETGGNYAIQGELMGPGIQGNREGLDRHHFYLFDIYSIDERRYLSVLERLMMWSKLKRFTKDVDHVPSLGLIKLPADNIVGLLEFAEGKSLNHSVREGVVFKRLDGAFSFKAISNNFLLKFGD